MTRPEVEEFKRLTSVPAHMWGMADCDVVDLCDYILYLESVLLDIAKSGAPETPYRNIMDCVEIAAAALWPKVR